VIIALIVYGMLVMIGMTVIANLDTQPKLNRAPQGVTAVTGIGRLWATGMSVLLLKKIFAHPSEQI
jgi:hypothetical protein